MKYAIHYATRMKDVLIFALVVSIIMFQVATLTEYSYPVLFYMQMAVNAVMLVALGIEAYARLIKRDIRIQEHSDAIVINGTEVKAREIREIKVSGCHKASFRLSLKDKSVSPMFCSFKFEDKDCEGVRQLTRWAERNGIAVRMIGPQTRSNLIPASK